MTSETFFGTHLAEHPVLAIFRGKSPAETVQLCHAAWDSGVQLIEVPVQSPEAFESFRAAVHAGKERGRPVGAGTVLTLDQLEEVRQAGGEFVVSPGFDATLARAAQDRGMPHLPGVATSSEISAALSAGCSWLKAFPARELSPSWIRAQRGPFPEVRFIATGGVDSQNATEFLNAGCVGVAVGSAFETEEGITQLARALRERSP